MCYLTKIYCQIDDYYIINKSEIIKIIKNLLWSSFFKKNFLRGHPPKFCCATNYIMFAYLDLLSSS